MARTHFVCWRKRSELLRNQDREVLLLRGRPTPVYCPRASLLRLPRKAMGLR